MKQKFLHRYRWNQHILVILPLAAGMTAILFLLGDEQQIDDRIVNLHRAWPALSRLADWFCDYGIIPFHLCYALILAVGVTKGKRSLITFALGYLAGLVFTIVTVDILKYTIGRPRPYLHTDSLDPFNSDNDYHSFPSGHIADSLIVAFPLAQRLGGRALPLVLGLFPLLTGLARIQMRHHQPSDFLGSIVVSSAGAILAREVSSRLASCRRLRLFAARRAGWKQVHDEMD